MILALLLQAAAPAAAPAVPPQPPATMMVEPAAMLIAGCDADGDARVTRGELDACLARSFATAGPDARGTIGLIGFSDWAERYLGDRNALPSPFETDTNGDDRIDLAELTAKFAEIFARLDRDRDGALTRAELLTIRAAPPRTDDPKAKKRRR